jgi:hypothetical protein
MAQMLEHMPSNQEALFQTPISQTGKKR